MQRHCRARTRGRHTLLRSSVDAALAADLACSPLAAASHRRSALGRHEALPGSPVAPRRAPTGDSCHSDALHKHADEKRPHTCHFPRTKRPGVRSGGFLSAAAFRRRSAPGAMGLYREVPSRPGALVHTVASLGPSGKHADAPTHAVICESNALALALCNHTSVEGGKRNAGIRMSALPPHQEAIHDASP